MNPSDFPAPIPSNPVEAFTQKIISTKEMAILEAFALGVYHEEILGFNQWIEIKGNLMTFYCEILISEEGKNRINELKGEKE